MLQLLYLYMILVVIAPLLVGVAALLADLAGWIASGRWNPITLSETFNAVLPGVIHPTNWEQHFLFDILPLFALSWLTAIVGIVGLWLLTWR